MARKNRRNRRKINFGKALPIVEKVGEGLARYGGAIPLVGGIVQAAGNAMDTAAEAVQGVTREEGKARKLGKFARRRPSGLARRRPDEAEAEAAPVPAVRSDAGPSRLTLGLGLAALLGLGLALGSR